MEKISARVSLCLLALMMAGCVRVSSDFAQDKRECQDQLAGLSPCVSFISEEEKHPSPVCCLRLGNNYDQKRRCLCMLVRDRNEPGLGFKINATLALALPFICHIPANATQCLDFLHLDPRSPDAQIFLQFSNSSGSRTSTISGIAADSGSSSSINRGKKWLNLAMLGVVSVWPLISSFISK
ncbi:non-specific lipid transfer protein GPI-anchored 22-like isoform X1 [Coffea arabica]|uniref:Non-specific lipid transfer protein GPI-anchored 22-like isoform X1 n=1 Tax=Coffea arabica TaxID=13443 RepID=A0A6P6SK66_COFAR|nr:protein YLS3-like isoform X1 [Coffea arabica]